MRMAVAVVIDPVTSLLSSWFTTDSACSRTSNTPGDRDQ